MLSTVILTKDNELNIAECIKPLDFSDEIIIIDDFSGDKTVAIAKKLSAKVFKRKLNDNFAAQRNFGLDKASWEWVLFLDPDERISDNTAAEILIAIKEENYAGFYFKRNDYFAGKLLSHGEVGSVRLLRLGRKDAGRWTRRIHETWNIDGSKAELKNPIMHYPHPRISDFIKNINYYASLHVRENMHEGKISNIFKIIFYPKYKFIKFYFFKLGFLDGVAGFVYAVIMSLHSFLAWSNIWLIQRNTLHK
ncbi:hypothetical protein A3A76_03330 [Candidatus Woesebacteria bacterium RIFCSPLOWO2_01_FULL_39_23]|uniref:Glycosyltransferase 2-like domain-containing protein n=1 Tax=Candidatus Woesebacteria bacterium RIFCSPHIGHO2_01_FULL_40_22 TaxID=1802499 RepID=A0A1F7YKT4_9BACT|nr:MAG: hypothetical protein A2141_00695 [Candidatus Woesebacteria bacterium RBG_16_40_11]OGM27489.1 MAG: hypothetical protein A2628_01730 [Candidatus Woesebacteria bacterium RIFCSPHIGHO2_01_FULL_40_22]OGM62663.1 MAG: hypothetical protein A3A76_03330 [Candidatus Woesebacteria bacterium RIFCSPLOWO2_01_FULL_39_23]